MAQFVRRDAAEECRALADNHLAVKGSAGQSKWADVPWISFLDPLETTSTQEGFYVVYLVNPVTRMTYLSLNQGVTAAEKEFGSGKKAHDMLALRGSILRRRVADIGLFDVDPIDLGGRPGLPAGYEAGHAFGFAYDYGDLSNAEQVERELALMLETYSALIAQGGYTIDPDAADRSDDRKGESLIEAKRRRLHERFDRLGANTSRVKKAKGYICEACDFDFEARYGPLGHEFIEAQHLVPFSELEENAQRKLNIETDFAVLCANCHRMIHRMPDPSDLMGLRQLLTENA